MVGCQIQFLPSRCAQGQILIKDFTAETVLQLHFGGGEVGTPGRGTACERGIYLA